MGTTPSVLDQAIARTLGSSAGSAPGSAAPAPAATGDVLDGAISRALGNKPPQAPPLTREQTLSRTLGNMTSALSGQPMAAPEDQARFEQGKEAGMESAAVQTAVSTGAGALAAPSAVTKAGPLVPAGRDAAGRFLPWVASQISDEGPSLARQGVSAATDFISDHPIAAKALGKILQGIGIGTAFHFLRHLGSSEP